MLSCVLAVLAIASVGADVVNTAVVRELDITTSFARTKTTFSVKNEGPTFVSDYTVAFVDSAIPEHVSVLVGGAPAELVRDGSQQGHAIFRTPVNLAGGNTVEVTVSTTRSRAMTPLPKKIAQNEGQFMVYEGSQLVASPYTSMSMQTTVLLPSSLVEEYTDSQAPTVLTGSELVYGPFSTVPPFAHSPMRVHFESNVPFLSARVTKEFDVSHWGNVGVRETTRLKHTGAVLTGAFSRFDYQRNPNVNGVHAVRSVHADLPAGSSGVLVRDDVGNISSTNLRIDDSGDVLLEIRPRFPLFGGWKTQFTLGYNLRIANVLLSEDTVYTLSVPMSTSLRNVAVSSLTVRVLLPEGATNIKALNLPRGTSWELEEAFGYLDTIGRPVVTFEATELVPEQNVEFHVSYEYSSLLMARKVVVLVLTYVAAFVVYMVYLRLNVNVSANSLATPEATRAVVALLGTQEEAAEEYERLDAACAKSSYSTAKATAQTNRQAIDASFKTHLKILDEHDAYAARKAHRLVVLEKTRREAHSELLQTRRLLVQKDINNKKFQSEMKQAQERYASVCDEIDLLITDLVDAC